MVGLSENGPYECRLSAELQRQAKEELNEDPDTRAQAIQEVRDWLTSQPHIRARKDDWTILRYLRGCKYDLERVKAKLETFYTIKTTSPSWYFNRDPCLAKMQEILNMGLYLPLPGYDKKGRKVIIVKASRHDPRLISIDEVYKATHLVADVLADEDEDLSVAGLVMVFDMEGLSVGHVLQMTPSIVRKCVKLWQDGFPMSPKSLNYINNPISFEASFSIVKNFLKEKMRNRVHIHGHNLESLYTQVPRSMLPYEYGGTNCARHDLTEHWKSRVMARRAWLLDEESYSVEEHFHPSLSRSIKISTKTTLKGITTNFSSLTVD